MTGQIMGVVKADFYKGYDKTSIEKNKVYTVNIEDMSDEGLGIGHIEGMAVFVKDTAPGDEAEVRIVKVKKNLCYGRLERIITPSSFRVEPFCPIAKQCGGCTLQHISYEKELEIKKHRVLNCLSRIGGIEEPEQYLEEETVDNYINLTQEWAIKKSGEVPLYHFKKGDYQSTWYIPFDGVSQRLSFLDSALNSSYIKYHCLLKLDDNLPIFRGFGASKSEARKAVCKVAYEYLEKHNLLFSIKDEIENPNKNEAISQLEILARRDYFSIPEYLFEQTYDENGNPIWSCECRIAEVDKTFGEQSSSKKEAKKGAAFKMLQYVLKAEEEK